MPGQQRQRDTSFISDFRGPGCIGKIPHSRSRIHSWSRNSHSPPCTFERNSLLFRFTSSALFHLWPCNIYFLPIVTAIRRNSPYKVNILRRSRRLLGSRAPQRGLIATQSQNHKLPAAMVVVNTVKTKSRLPELPNFGCLPRQSRGRSLRSNLLSSSNSSSALRLSVGFSPYFSPANNLQPVVVV